MGEPINYNQCKVFLQNNKISNGAIEKMIQTKDPAEFRSKLETLQSQLPGVLEDFKKYYVAYNKNPEYPDYQQMFANAKSNLTDIGSKLFDLLNDIQYDTDDLNQKILCLNAAIVQEKNKNRMLKKGLGIIEEKNNASTEMIDDYRTIYDEGYLRNWGLFLSIVIAFVAVKNMYAINGDMATNLKNMSQNVSNMGNNLKNIGTDAYNNVKSASTNMYNKANNMYRGNRV